MSLEKQQPRLYSVHQRTIPLYNIILKATLLLVILLLRYHFLKNLREIY